MVFLARDEGEGEEVIGHCEAGPQIRLGYYGASLLSFYLVRLAMAVRQKSFRGWRGRVCREVGLKAGGTRINEPDDRCECEKLCLWLLRRNILLEFLH